MTSDAPPYPREMNHCAVGGVYGRSSDHLCIRVARWRSNCAVIRVEVRSSRSLLCSQFAAGSARTRERESLLRGHAKLFSPTAALATRERNAPVAGRFGRVRVALPFLALLPVFVQEQDSRAIPIRSPLCPAEIPALGQFLPSSG